jgi:hypothetical protein
MARAVRGASWQGSGRVDLEDDNEFPELPGAKKSAAAKKKKKP